MMIMDGIAESPRLSRKEPKVVKMYGSYMERAYAREEKQS